MQDRYVATYAKYCAFGNLHGVSTIRKELPSLHLYIELYIPMLKAGKLKSLELLIAFA